jgi:ABC-type glycerol-3-phosphate transport system permease component
MTLTSLEADRPTIQAGSVAAKAPPLTRLLSTVALVVLSLIYLAPFIWMISTSLKTAAQAIATPPVLVPNPLVWVNYPDAFVRMSYPRSLLNTLIYTVPSMVATIVSCSLVAYGFAIIRWPGRNIVFVLVLATMMLPGQVTLIPLYVIFAKLGLTNSYWPLVLPSFFCSTQGAWSGAFFIFLLRQFFLGIPRELVDAARIDGCSELRILFQIVVPLSMPAIITVGLLTFIDKWNDFYGPLIYLQDPTLFPLARAAQVFQAQHKQDWAQAMSAAVITALPLVILYFFAQRKFIEGITLTGSKS